MADDLLDAVQAALGVTDMNELADGGQKKVYTALLGARGVVVKVISVPAGAHAVEVVERAHREVDLLSAVESDHVVAVLSEAVEIGDAPEAVCWVEELLDGEDLKQRKGTFPWPESEAVAFLRDLASGLTACHDLNVVHRDLSDANVRRRADGRYVLMDPGWARHLAKTAITGVYQPGTMGYISPEHAPGGKPTPASDVFAAGILVHEALTTVLPFTPGGDEAAYIQALRTTQAASIKSMRPDLSDGLASIVDTCLQRQPARRYLDAGELLGAVNQLMGTS